MKTPLKATLAALVAAGAMGPVLAQNTCEPEVGKLPKKADVSRTVVGLYLDSTEEVSRMVHIFDSGPVRDMYRKWGCAEIVLMQKESGKVVKHIDLVPAESIEEPTAENIEKLLNLSIGFRRRELVVIKELQNWYEVNPDNPDAVALGKELCANRHADPTARLLAMIGKDPKDDARRKQSFEIIHKSDPLSEKLQRVGDLSGKISGGLEELEGMGFNCSQ